MTRKVIRATLDLLATDRGGRDSAIRSGYRSLARFEGVDADFGFELDLDAQELAPGDRGAGRLSFWAVDEVPTLSEGQQFEVREGARVIGHGTIADAGTAS
jgi:translation elongation factor EF-Tu-like GTPase